LRHPSSSQIVILPLRVPAASHPPFELKATAMTRLSTATGECPSQIAIAAPANTRIRGLA
jgi:hypothetical protein